MRDFALHRVGAKYEIAAVPQITGADILLRARPVRLLYEGFELQHLGFGRNRRSRAQIAIACGGLARQHAQRHDEALRGGDGGRPAQGNETGGIAHDMVGGEDRDNRVGRALRR